MGRGEPGLGPDLRRRRGTRSRRQVSEDPGSIPEEGVEVGTVKTTTLDGVGSGPVSRSTGGTNCGGRGQWESVVSGSGQLRRRKTIESLNGTG